LETQDRSFSCALFFHGDDDDDHHRAHEIEKTRLDNSENGETHSSQGHYLFLTLFLYVKGYLTIYNTNSFFFRFPTNIYICRY
jgi:hypothetical protein